MGDFVAVEFDTYDTGTSAIVSRYLCSSGPLARLSGATGQYIPALLDLPIMLGASLDVEQYGQSPRGTVNAATIKFAIDSSMYSWFASNYHWIGHAFRVYSADAFSASIADYTLVYTGRIGDLSLTDIEATVTVGDASVALDGAIVSDFYGSSAITTLVGRPKPKVWGQVRSIDPILENEATLLYRVSTRSGGIASIGQTRVGGIPWNQITTGPTPVARGGQWQVTSLANGTFVLGALTNGAEVRCDVNSSDYATMDTSALLTSIVGGLLTMDSGSMAQLTTDYPALVGFKTGLDPLNRLDVMDDIMRSAVGWWYVTAAETVRAGIVAAPGTPSLYLNAAGSSVSGPARAIQSVTLSSVIPPAYRVRVESNRIWDPQTVFYETVAQLTQDIYKSSGHVNEAAVDTALQTADPRAIDMPLVRALCALDADGQDLRDRVAAAFSSQRFIFDVEAWLVDGDIDLYDSVQLTWGPWDLPCRVHQLLIPYGGGAPARLRLWG